ncbi:hypothetical protein IFM89_004500 [Coptis chinensis]|uniref:Uncharacterized protein n=1 Tax=Coptis chinensis TaxID=261450 RepID=A0A835GYS8_9MAGN|nr:hypothetical protein IFM89_004500 [Coptis chinensis]
MASTTMSKATTLMNFISKTPCLSSTKPQKTPTCFSPLRTLMLCSSTIHLLPIGVWDQHRRSLSVTDIGSDPFGWKPCLYYARGYCKNGTSCRFLHESPDSTAFGAEFDVMDQCHELLRSRSLKHCQHQQQRLTNASQLLASGSFPYTGSKCSNFLLQQQQNDTLRAAAGLMLDGDDLHHYGRSRIERSDFLSIPGGMANSASRQIYLTFPADSTFREEDVSNYFSIYGPVQDVRIPYQQKRMFGFVTFIYSETVKLILAKGNPHFVCDARVLVKPYKEKGKVPDRKQQQPMMELGDFSPSGITGHDHRDPFDLQFSMQMESSPRMYNTNELLMRRKLEQAELQQAMELHSRKLMGLHLFDGNKHHRRNLSTGTGSVPSPIHSHAYVNQNFMIPTSSPGQSSPMTQLDNCAVSCATSLSLSTIADNVSKPQAELDRGDNDAEENFKHGDNNTHVSVEHNLPDNPFASPTKSNADPSGMSFTSAAEVGQSISATLAPSSPSNNTSLISSLVLPATSTLDMASFKSCYLQMPRNAESNQDQGGGNVEGKVKNEAVIK